MQRRLLASYEVEPETANYINADHAWWVVEECYLDGAEVENDFVFQILYVAMD